MLRDRAYDVWGAPPWLAVGGMNLLSPISEILSADRARRR
jgi:hypothetical protein